jgi:Tfp pilus assembly protein PilO
MSLFKNLAHMGTIAGVVAAGAGYFFLVDRPSQADTAQIRSEIADKQQYIQKAEALVPQIAQSERESKEALEHVDEWRRATPKAEEISQLYGRIQTAIRSERAVVTKFEPQPAVVLASMQQVPLMLTFLGDQQQVAKALADIERLSVTIWVRDVRLSQAAEDKSKVQCEVKLVIFTDHAENSH